MADLQTILNLLYPVIFLCITIGGVVSYRKSQHKTMQEIARNATEVQDHVINAQKAELETLKDRLDTLEKKNIRLEQTLGIIKAAFRKKGIIITIDGDIVSISDQQGNSHSAEITGQMRIEEAR